MRFHVLSLSSIFLSLFSTLGKAIFADEAYQTDYHHALLGLPQAHATFFHRSSVSSKASLLYTLSERSVLGAINPKDGTVIWRQRIADQVHNETAPGLLRGADGEDTILTVHGGHCQCWDATDGRLVWHWTGIGQIKSLEISGATRDLLILEEEPGSINIVRKLAADKGAVLWEHKDSSGVLPYAVVPCKDSVFSVSLHLALLKGSKFKVTELSANTGDAIGQPLMLSSDSEVISKESILYSGTHSDIALLIWTDKALGSLKFNILGTKQITSFKVPTNDGDRAEKITVHAPSSTATKAHLLVHYQGVNAHWAEVYHVNSQEAKKAYDLSPVNGKGAFAASSQDFNVYFTRHTALDNTLISSGSPIVLKQWNVQPRSRDGQADPQDVAHAVSEVVTRDGSTYAVRSAFTTSSGNWQLTRNGDSVWTRPEGLTGVVAAVFVQIAQEVTLAEELAVEGQSGPVAAYVHRVRRHLRDLQYLPAWADALPKRLLSGLTGGELHSQGRGVQRDSFGFHQLVLVATSNGRLAALDAGNRGTVVWSIQAIALKLGQTWEVLSIEAEGGTALVRGKGGEFLRIAMSTGAVLQYQHGAIVPSLKTSVPVIDTSGTEILIPVNDDGSLGDFSRADFGQETIVVVSKTGNVVQGWALSKSSKAALVWKFSPGPGQNVTSVSARPSHDPVASIGKALGDRNVLYKYLNPNVLLVTAVETGASTANFYVLDSASGTVLHSTSHSGVDTSKSVVTAMSENWFAYSLFSEATTTTQGSDEISRETSKGYQLVISELYESSYPNDRGSLGSSSNSSSIYSLLIDANDTPVTPHVISQTFLIPGPISSMSVTSTLQGITTRSLLCAIPELHAIMSLPRAFVDPRRPVSRDPTAAEMEEGLFRYSPTLDFEPKWMLSHKRELLSVSEVITSPSLLESTSLVFAFGEIDLFGTRTAPIGAFDILGKGFSKVQLVLTVVALALATILVAPFVRRKQIDATWKA